MEREQLIERLRVLLSDYEGIACAWLFGSRARGQARAGSDVDLAVLMTHTPAPTLAGAGFDLADSLSAALRLSVQVIIANTAPVDLMHRVLRDGMLVAETNPSARIRFEVATRNEWFDLKPILDEYRRVGRFANG